MLIFVSFRNWVYLCSLAHSGYNVQVFVKPFNVRILDVMFRVLSNRLMSNLTDKYAYLRVWIELFVRFILILKYGCVLCISINSN